MEELTAMDTDNYVVFLPGHMWNPTFNEIWDINGISFTEGKSLKPFPVGVDGEKRTTHQIVLDTLEEGKQILQEQNKTPIFVFPITLVPQYAAGVSASGKDIPQIRILGPAFKTRDDIFLFLGNGRDSPHDGKATIAYKGADMTTTVVAEAYGRDVIEAGADPIFNIPWGQQGGNGLKWPYFLSVKSHRGKKREKCVTEDNWHGLIAAGPELPKFWNKPDWIAAVNLNAWICRRLRVTYFVRAVFCSLAESFQNGSHLSSLLVFWNTFCQSGPAWLKSVAERCGKADKACIAGKVPYPVQSPSVTDTGEAAVRQLAFDIESCTQFMQMAYAIKKTYFEDCPEEKHSNFHVCEDNVLWEIYRHRRATELKKEILEKYVAPSFPVDTHNKLEVLETEFSGVMNAFMEDSYGFTLESGEDTAEKLAASFRRAVKKLLPGKDENLFPEEKTKVYFQQLLRRLE